MTTTSLWHRFTGDFQPRLPRSRGCTVNLASRMQSTGQPGRIQVSEGIYRRVTAMPNQPFTFDSPKTTFCKGFGSRAAEADPGHRGGWICRGHLVDKIFN